MEHASDVQDVVGVSPDVQGARMGVRLLRSVLTLGAIHLLRFGFAVGTAQVGASFITVLWCIRAVVLGLESAW